MMSVTESDIGWSWFTTLFIMYIIIATATMGVSTQLYINSSTFLLWIFWFFTCLAILVFSMFIAAFSSKTTRSVLIGLVLIFVGIFLPLIVDYQTGSSALVALLSLHPITAMSYGLQEIGYLEDAGVGVTVNTAGSSDHSSGFAFTNAIGSLIFDCVLWGVLSWYLNRVIRPDYGQALPFYFPFTLSYWCPGTSRSPPRSDETDEDANPNIPIEPVSDNLRVSVPSCWVSLLVWMLEVAQIHLLSNSSWFSYFQLFRPNLRMGAILRSGTCPNPLETSRQLIICH